MANRPVFTIKSTAPHYEEIAIEFQYYSGFADVQRQRSSASLRDAYIKKHPGANVLEISRFSDSYLGQRLSAFNLFCELDDGTRVPVECAFQGSKVFELGGPYTDLFGVHPAKAKKDERLVSSGRLKAFRFQGVEFPLEPKTFFYDWLYINALVLQPDISEELCRFDAFTDIVFNPEKSINCQARTVAIYVSLIKSGLLDTALENAESFRKTVYEKAEPFTPSQISLF